MDNPYFERQVPPRLVAWFRVHHWDVVSIVICLSLATSVIWGDRLKITSVRVEGNRDLTTQQITEIVQRQRKERALWFFPQSNILFFDLDQLRNTLEEKYAFEELNLRRGAPNQIQLRLKERVLGVTWIASDRKFYLDLRGIISQALDAKKEPNRRYPEFHDINQSQLQLHNRALTEQMVHAMIEIQEKWRLWSKGTIGYFTTPKITCTETVEQRSVIPIDYPTTPEEAAQLKEQGNVVLDDVKKIASVIRVEKIEKEILCKSYDHIKELYVVTTDGWKVYFDIDQSIEDQLKSLSLTLREVERLNTIRYFDLRTPTRVYYQ
ncbi:MAG: FtsQ-type POTRA domain-containing protein [Patescibacteria group bacterium]